MNVNNRWKPVETYQTKSISESQTEEQHVKRKFKSIDDVMMGSNTLAQHKTYHVPPGKKFVVFLKLLGFLGFPGVLSTICSKMYLKRDFGKQFVTKIFSLITILS